MVIVENKSRTRPAQLFGGVGSQKQENRKPFPHYWESLIKDWV